MLIRRVEANDADAVFSVLDRCYRPGDSEYWSRQSVVDFLNADAAIAYLAPGEQCGSYVGCALARGAAGDAEVLNIAVMPSARRRGIAAALLATLLGDEVGHWSLEVRADNAAAIALYRSAGFVQAGLRANYYRRGDGVKIDAIIMSQGR